MGVLLSSSMMKSQMSKGRQQILNDRLKKLTKDNKSFQVTASYLLDLAQRAEELFKCSNNELRQKLLNYMISNVELKDKKLSYILTDPFREMAEQKKKAQTEPESNIWQGVVNQIRTALILNQHYPNTRMYFRR